jgi:hypothetical protein
VDLAVRYDSHGGSEHVVSRTKWESGDAGGDWAAEREEVHCWPARLELWSIRWQRSRKQWRTHRVEVIRCGGKVRDPGAR